MTSIGYVKHSSSIIWKSTGQWGIFKLITQAVSKVRANRAFCKMKKENHKKTNVSWLTLVSTSIYCQFNKQKKLHLSIPRKNMIILKKLAVSTQSKAVKRFIKKYFFLLYATNDHQNSSQSPKSYRFPCKHSLKIMYTNSLAAYNWSYRMRSRNVPQTLATVNFTPFTRAQYARAKRKIKNNTIARLLTFWTR